MVFKLDFLKEFLVFSLFLRRLKNLNWKVNINVLTYMAQGIYEILKEKKDIIFEDFQILK